MSVVIRAERITVWLHGVMLASALRRNAGCMLNHSAYTCIYCNMKAILRISNSFDGCIVLSGLILLFAVGCKFIRSDNLNQAIVRGEIESVRVAIVHGTDANGRGMHAVTPLMKAAGTGRLDICQLLVEHGANVNGHNGSGSVLMWAVHSENESLIRYLLKAGADKSWTNSTGQSAEGMARDAGLLSIASLLRTSSSGDQN